MIGKDRLVMELAGEAPKGDERHFQNHLSFLPFQPDTDSAVWQQGKRRGLDAETLRLRILVYDNGGVAQPNNRICRSVPHGLRAKSRGPHIHGSSQTGMQGIIGLPAGGDRRLRHPSIWSRRNG